MRLLPILCIGLLAITIVSCQKEIDWSVNPSTGTGTGGGGTGGTGGGTSGNSNGDLLVKAVAVTAGTTDTNFIYLTWDANKRLTQYKSTGKTNGFDANAQYDIVRLPNGDIKKIYSKPFAPFPGMPVSIDSMVTDVYYQPGTSKFHYAVTTTYTSFLNSKDSIVFAYNTSGKVSTKTTYRESILTGTMDISTKETYTYDANGNVTTVSAQMADLLTGTMSNAGSTVMTYNTHKSPWTIGDEAFIILSPENTAVNYADKKVQSGAAGGGSVSGTVTGTLTNTQYNSFDRPTKGTITTTPMPPGYVINYSYYYQ